MPFGCNTCTVQSLCWLQSFAEPLLATVIDVFNLQVGFLCAISCTNSEKFDPFGNCLLHTVFHVHVFKFSVHLWLYRVFHYCDMLQCMHSKTTVCVAKWLIMFLYVMMSTNLLEF